MIFCQGSGPFGRPLGRWSQMGVKTEPKTEPETGPLKKACPSEQKIPRSKKGSKKVPQKGGTLWDAFLFSVALLFFARFRGLPSSLWTRICTKEGGRGKGKPSQLEDWKSLKPKPPQPRGLVGFLDDSAWFCLEKLKKHYFSTTKP